MSSVCDAYAPLLRVGVARRLVASAGLARLSIAVLDIPLILLVQAQTHSYALAGVAIALDGVGIAVAAPLRGRALDRFGSARTVPALGVVRAFLLAAVWPLADAGQAAGVLALVLVAGLCQPPVSSAMRLQWKRLLGEGERLARAYALESVLQVSLFVVGPAVAALGISVLGSGPTLVVASGLLIVGAGAFGRCARDDRRSQPGPSRSGVGGVIRVSGVQTLVASTLVVDAALGLVNVTVPAFARQHGDASVAGLALAAFSLAGAVAGAVYGAHDWTAPARRRLIILTAAAAALDVPLVFAPSLAWLVGLLVFAGLPGAAQWTTSYVCLDHVAPPAGAGEALNWIGAANAAGVAAGESVAGIVIDAAGPRVAFAVAVVLLLTGAALLFQRRGTLASG